MYTYIVYTIRPSKLRILLQNVIIFNYFFPQSRRRRLTSRRRHSDFSFPIRPANRSANANAVRMRFVCATGAIAAVFLFSFIIRLWESVNSNLCTHPRVHENYYNTHAHILILVCGRMWKASRNPHSVHNTRCDVPIQTLVVVTARTKLGMQLLAGTHTQKQTHIQTQTHPPSRCNQANH